MLWQRIWPCFGSRMASQNPRNPHQDTFRTKAFNRLDHIIGTGRLKATRRRKYGRDPFLIASDHGNQDFFHAFLDLVTARLCSWLISFLFKRRYSPGRSPETSRFPNWVRESLSTKSPTASNIFLTWWLRPS